MLLTFAGVCATANENFNGANLFTLQDVIVNAEDLNTIDGLTSGAINATNVATITSTASEAKTAYSSNQITGIKNKAVTITGSISAADAKLLMALQVV